MDQTAPNTSSGPHLVLPTTLRQNYYAQDGDMQPKEGPIYTQAQAYLKGSCASKPHALRAEIQPYVEMRKEEGTAPVVAPSSRGDPPERSCIPKWSAEPKVYNHLGSKQDDRYRHIEDLAQYLDGSNADGASYFNDPMQRRAAARTAARSADEGDQAKSDNVILIGQVDPRRGVVEEKAAVDRSAIIPSKALESKHKFEATTGQVKPYALKHATHATEKPEAPCNHRAMEEYVARMQCQRPTKGVYTPH